VIHLRLSNTVYSPLVTPDINLLIHRFLGSILLQTWSGEFLECASIPSTLRRVLPKKFL